MLSKTLNNRLLVRSSTLRKTLRAEEQFLLCAGLDGLAAAALPPMEDGNGGFALLAHFGRRRTIETSDEEK